MRPLGQLVPTPAFWDTRGPLSSALRPLSSVYAAGARLVEALAPPPYRAPVPVICVGAAVTGGAGKTPVALALALRLASRYPKLRLNIIARGEGGTNRGPLQVQPHHAAMHVGDEAILLSRAAPTWVARNRALGAQAACIARPASQLLLLDDGLQHHSLHRDLSLLVVDALEPLGNGYVLPAGPLREPFERALARSHALIALAPPADRHGQMVGEPPTETRLRRELRLPACMPVLRVAARVESAAAQQLAGRSVVPFSGTARPRRFFDTLRALGCAVYEPCALPDHAPISNTTFDHLRRIAARHGALLATTEKDAARLSPDLLEQVCVLRLELYWQADAAARLDALIAPLIPTACRGTPTQASLFSSR